MPPLWLCRRYDRILMLRTLKEKVKASFAQHSFAYRSLAWAYRLPHRLRKSELARLARETEMRLRKDSRFRAIQLWMAESNQPKVLGLLVTELDAKSLLDVGCGVGQTLRHAQNLGLEILGLEGSSAAISASPIADRISMVNLNEPHDLQRRFDLVWSVEVAEHIHPKYTAVFLDTLVRHGDNVLLSAAPPGQGGAGHFNEQPQAYWIDLMEKRGFCLNSRLTQEIQVMGEMFCENMMFFSRTRASAYAR
jgi:2-polyprenyl-3-methyl-5-hydroxy-6-metoxy-1,4-benzoquinol methylase